MRVSGLALAALVAMAAGASAARAETFQVRTTGDLLAVCAPAGNAAPGATRFCEGFMLGSGQLYEALRAAGAIESPWACADPTPSMTRVRESFVGWARNHPEAHGSTAVDGFWKAMAATWPC